MRYWIRFVWVVSAIITLVGCTPVSLPSGSQPTPAFEELVPLATQFVNRLASADFGAASAPFDGTMKNVMPEAKLKEVWGQLLTQVGAYQKQTGTRTAESQGYRIVFVTCQFEKAALDVQVVFNTQKQISGLFFKPASAGTPTPQPLSQPTNGTREVEVMVGSGEWATPGVLSLPAGSGPFPAVVLLHGSGPADRDETIGPNKPLRDIAWGLVNRGVAVLRYDKRTFTYASLLAGKPELREAFTVQQEVLQDAAEAIRLLRSNPVVDARRIYVAGHSMGGILAPRAAQQDVNLAGIIILAGTPRPLEDLMVEQYSYIFNLDGELSGSERAQLDAVKTQVARIKQPNLDPKTPAQDLMGANAAYWLDLRAYNPGETARSLAQPILVLQGGRDYQVLADKDFTAWKTALAGKNNVTFKLYPDLNHLFISGSGPSTPQEYEKSGKVSEDVIRDMANWILQN